MVSFLIMGAALKVTDTSGGGATFVIDFFMAQKNNENDVYDMKKRLK